MKLPQQPFHLSRTTHGFMDANCIAMSHTGCLLLDEHELTLKAASRMFATFAGFKGSRELVAEVQPL